MLLKQELWISLSSGRTSKVKTNWSLLLLMVLFCQELPEIQSWHLQGSWTNLRCLSSPSRFKSLPRLVKREESTRHLEPVQLLSLAQYSLSCLKIKLTQFQSRRVRELESLLRRFWTWFWTFSTGELADPSGKSKCANTNEATLWQSNHCDILY